jgi:hypothetical protein
MLPPEELSQIATDLIEQGHRHGVELRLFGGLGCWLKSPHTRAQFDSRFSRDRDIDLFTPRCGLFELNTFPHRCGFDRTEVESHKGGSVLRLTSRVRGEAVEADIFVGRLNFSHGLNFGLEVLREGITFPFPELLIAKLQIHELTAADPPDLVMMTAEYDYGHDRGNGEDLSRAAEYCGRDYGLSLNVLSNIDKVEEWLESQHLPTGLATSSRLTLEKLRSLVKAARKTLRWKARSILGQRLSWYDHAA